VSRQVNATFDPMGAKDRLENFLIYKIDRERARERKEKQARQGRTRETLQGAARRLGARRILRRIEERSEMERVIRHLEQGEGN